MHEQIRDAIQQRREAYTELLKQWVQEPTLSGQEARYQHRIAELYRELGLDTDLWEIDIESLKGNPLFHCQRDTLAGSPNVVGTWKGTGGGRSLILNGHVDVVPEGDHAQWDQHPYSGQVIDGCLYGRGVTDMKGGNLSAYVAVATLKALGIRLKGDVILQSVIEEEAGGAGTLAALERGYTADAALIPEPTEQNLFPRQQGSRWFRLKVAGIKAHGGTRYEGVSALEKSVAVIATVQALEAQRNADLDDPLYAGVPIPLPINLGRIEGGDWPSSVPDEITLEGRIGVGPGETVAAAEQALRTAMAALADQDAWFAEHPVEVEFYGACWQPGGIDLDNPLVDKLSSAFERVHQRRPELQASPWGTDGGLLSQYGVPAMVFGPGITRLAHFPNEHIRLDDVFDVAEIMALTLIDWCELAE
ncbi:peptidase [Halomonas icarae]|uniref:Peptidase n=1 Tax=Halomonas icarae TaxID=2691040 RepID=A0A7X4W1Y1_9GAMM|nr:peptidase [Halomonas icarae]MDR5903439.1 peptidase [Halomonas icarae]NAW14307.1 peptidase [Halomonas icarae]